MLDLIPVLSYVFLRGRCRTCGGGIPIRYLLTELFCGLLWVLAWNSAFTLEMMVVDALFASVLLLATVIDLEHHRIPDPVSLAGLVLALFTWGYSGFAISSLLLAVVVFIFTYILAYFGFGGGDIKLATVIALYLGWPYGLMALFLSFFVGAVAGVVLILLNIKSRRDFIPFGPFLAIGSWLTMFYGEQLLRWYLLLIGW